MLHQINPLSFSLPPRAAMATDLELVFSVLISGPELNHPSASLPMLPVELAERIMDEAHYWQGVQHTKRDYFEEDNLEVSVPLSTSGTSIRVKAIQVLRDWQTQPFVVGDVAFDVVVRDAQGAVQSEAAVRPTFVDTVQLVTIWPANLPIIRQMREGWQVQVRPSSSLSHRVRYESLYVGYEGILATNLQSTF
ncbi:hypothetical protein CAOG_06874 [Capsaspora owczarzaki ATCC 30864]|nr:hypothetical protein CAOG_06874 [Capsaspora owczarzaki ATCC 30864]|eukprot:XP_004344495.2 hypothetical protein CAOG_06874 [Capsaspora owczarzaki ATCC 30864]